MADQPAWNWPGLLPGWRTNAIANLGLMRLSGFPAWVVWLLVHISYLIGFRNRLLAMIEWAWAYLTYQRGARLITENCTEPLLLPIARQAVRTVASAEPEKVESHTSSR